MERECEQSKEASHNSVRFRQPKILLTQDSIASVSNLTASDSSKTLIHARHFDVRKILSFLVKITSPRSGSTGSTRRDLFGGEAILETEEQ
jgi:hypothetical protein